MSLQGTFDVFSLPELLRMLAASSKSGALIVEAGGIAGRVDLRDGECVAAETVELRGVVAGDELHARLVEVCFAIVRETTGAFRFAAGDPPSFDCGTTVAVEPVLAEMELLLAEWRDLTVRIPSLDVRPVLVAELSGDSITLQANEWALLARFDGHTSVRDLVEARRRSLVEVCRAVADLVDRGAVTLVDGPAPEAKLVDPSAFDVNGAPADMAHDAGFVMPVAPYGPGVDALLDPDAADFDPAAAVMAAAGAPGTGLDLGTPVDSVDPSEPFTHGDEPVAGAFESDPDGAGDLSAAALANLGEVPDAASEAMLSAMPDPALVPAAAAADGDEGDARDRGAILRLFSALREV